MRTTKFYVKYETPELESEPIQITYHFTKAETLRWVSNLLSDGRKIIEVGRNSQQ